MFKTNRTDKKRRFFKKVNKKKSLPSKWSIILYLQYFFNYALPVSLYRREIN